MRLYCCAHVPDGTRHMIALVDLTDAVRAMLLSLRNVRRVVKIFRHVGDNLYALEIFDRTPTIRFGHGREVGADAFDTWCPVDDRRWRSLRRSRSTDFGEHPRVDCLTLLVLDDGVQWTWYEKGCSDLCTTLVLPWHVIAGDPCEKCGTPLSRESIDGGRCLGSDADGNPCGASIAAEGGRDGDAQADAL